MGEKLEYLIWKLLKVKAKNRYEKVSTILLKDKIER